MLKDTCLKCTSECGMIVNEPYHSWQTVPKIRPAHRESTSAKRRPCPTDSDRSGGRQA